MASPADAAMRLAGLVVVLAGLFGMQGLANQGVDVMENMPQAVVAETSTIAAGTSHLMSASVGHQALPLLARARVAVAVSGAGHKGAGMDMPMACLCLAILAIGLGTWLTLRGRRISQVLCLVPRVAPSPLRQIRDPDPPSLTSLSILRC